MLPNSSSLLLLVLPSSEVTAPLHPEEGCVDFAFTHSPRSLEGPLLRTCSGLQGDGNEKVGFVTKCCGRSEVIDPDAKGCVRAEEAVSHER